MFHVKHFASEHLGDPPSFTCLFVEILLKRNSFSINNLILYNKIYVLGV